MNKKPLYIVASVAGVLLIAGLVFYFLHNASANNANMPGGVEWQCTNKSCNNQFHMTVSEYGDWTKKHYGERMTCPKCGQPAVRAIKCPSCGAVSPMTQNATVCPVCKKPLPPA